MIKGLSMIVQKLKCSNMNPITKEENNDACVDETILALLRFEGPKTQANEVKQ